MTPVTHKMTGVMILLHNYSTWNNCITNYDMMNI